MDNKNAVIYTFPKRRQRWVWPYIAAIGILFIAVLLSCVAAKAQQTDPLQSLSMDWSTLATAQGHVATGIQSIASELTAVRKKIADMDAYLKACGDKPGCTVPAEAK